jgi:ornithine decarboxylase
MESSMHDAHFTLSRSAVIAQYKKIEHLGIIAYSIKTNPLVTPILEENTTCHFHIHTMHDLQYVKNPDKVWYLLQGSSLEDIKELVDKGVNKFIADNVVDLAVLQTFLNTATTKIDLLLRLRMKEATMQTGRFFVFGMERHIIEKQIATLRPHEKIRKLGVHFHRKTQNISEWNIQHDVQLSDDALKNIDILDIGGGLPARYKNTSDANLPNIMNKIEDARQWLQQYNIELMIEPGRFLSASPIKLHTTIQAVYDHNIIINASVYNAAMDSILVTPIRLLVEEEESKGESYVIKGCTPDSMDVFRYGVKLMTPPKKGDKITFLNAGAYNFSTNYYGLPTLKTVIID